MMDLAHIEAAEWIGALRFRLRFADGTAGVADLAPELGEEPGALAVIRDTPAAFTVAPRGRALVWRGADGEDVDFCADMLRGLVSSAQQAAE
jgi:hypothetical protein